jgi:hypothetical protein
MQCKHGDGAIHDDGHRHDGASPCYVHSATGMHVCHTEDGYLSTNAEPLTTEEQVTRARRLGAVHYGAGVHLDMQDEDSAQLMDALNETGPTTEDNHPARYRMCEAYEDGRQAAAGGA